MPEPPSGGGDDDTEVAEPDDPESAPAIPAAAVAGHAAALRRADLLATDREIWRLAWPVILSQVLASAVSLVDIAMLGRLGSSSLAAVGYVTQIFLLSQAVLFAIGVAGVALMSRAIGAGDLARARTTLASCLGISIAVAALLAGADFRLPRICSRKVCSGSAPRIVDVPLTTVVGTAEMPYRSASSGNSVASMASAVIRSLAMAKR